MEIPRFSVGNFDARIAGSDPGDAFQTFAAEALRRRYPTLHVYQARGRDGSIDLDTSTQVVIECKHSDGRDVSGAWTEVAERLERHLADPGGPGQSQYRPWYAKGDDAIAAYVFATDAEFANKSRRDEFRDTIRSFFQGLAARPHLAHLRDLSVDLLDWSDFASDLKTQPELVFRWFPATRPTGLTPLDDVQESRFFRAFLNEGTLPYYSRAEHIAAAGGEVSGISPEDDLVAMLDRESGLIITGKGGVGKTRLTLELGRRAKKRGWLVLRASSTFREESLDALLGRLVESTKVLLLIDYVEMIASFADRIEHIDMLNATLRHRVRYIANCRTSYYRNVQTIGGHVRVDISPAAGEPSPWLEGYRRAIVERVLASSEIDVTAAHLKVCRDVPVFAVFMAYLQRQKRTGDLYELVTDGEFGSWIARRIQQSFGRPIGGDLAMMIASFPMNEGRLRALPPSMRELCERLAADGWIEQLTEGLDAGYWVTAHDALADRVLLNHLENLGAAAGAFVEDLLDFAEANGTIASVLIALQRLADAPVLQSLDWVGYFAQRINRRSPAWLTARMLMLQNNLIAPAQRIELLEQTPDCWNDLGDDTTFQNTLGWISKQLTETTPLSQILALRTWILRSASAANRSNYMLARGLVLFPELRTIAEQWLAAHPLEFQTHYLLVTWLEQKFDPGTIAPYVPAWIERFAFVSQGSFLIKAWLDAGGEPAAIANGVSAWLSSHETRDSARFVYRPWLEATGDRALVKDGIGRWLVHHAESDFARFIYCAWLDATRDRALVEDSIRRWLVHHAESDGARFVYRSWLEATGDRALVEDSIRLWLVHHAELDVARFVYGTWLDATRDRALVEEPIRRWLVHHAEMDGAGFIYRAWLDVTRNRALVEEPIRRWLVHHAESGAATFVYRSWLAATSDGGLVEDSIRRWLVHHAESDTAQFVYDAWLEATRDRTLVEDAIRRWLVHHAEMDGAGFLYRAWLDATRDRALVEDSIQRWLVHHADSNGAGFLYRAWLDATRDRAFIEDSIQRWLGHHADSDGAQFVYSAWLNAGGHLDFVESHVTRFIENNREDPQISFLIVAYLKRNGSFDRVSNAALAAMARLRDSPDGSFVAKVLAKQKTLPDRGVIDVLAWCKRYAQDPDALWRLSQLQEKVAQPAAAIAAVHIATEILTYWQSCMTASQRSVIANVSNIIGSLALITDMDLRAQVDDLLIRWLRHPLGFSAATFGRSRIVPRLVVRVHELITRELLDVVADDDALVRLVRWAQRSDAFFTERQSSSPEWFRARIPGQR